ncbi:ABC-ATPase domain-containing protein [Actinobaculum massiliense]|uniref:ABC-ATPase domain-containing protein n=1 Tax=Actinobaculum massiliense TaxID=202789 RepID=UPI00288A98B5|nr:ABC-ATPase domain-containing protein [Actinobaculum massiliense]
MPRNFAGLLRSLDGKPYGAYRDAVGAHDVGGGLAVSLDRAQRDPFAPPLPRADEYSRGGCRAPGRCPQ